MKKTALIVSIVTLFTLTSCGVGTYSLSSGMEDKGAVCFVDDKSYAVDVEIDGVSYQTETVRQKDWKARRNIKKTAKRRIVLAPGKHTIKVRKKNSEIYSHTVFISATETKMIEL